MSVVVASAVAQPVRSKPIMPAGEASSAIAAPRAQLVASTRRNRSRARERDEHTADRLCQL
jgi:hypothetical protein